MNKKGEFNRTHALIAGGAALILIAVFLGFGGGDGTPSADGVDTFPSISFEDCRAELLENNPEMSDQLVNDNCYTIEAVNEGDVDLCDKVSPGFRENCLSQFE